jgi:hypothetical protein
MIIKKIRRPRPKDDIGNTWIVTFGRTGSTFVFSMFKFLRCDVGYEKNEERFSEHPKLVEINEKIIDAMYSDLNHPYKHMITKDPGGWFIKDPPDGWEKWLYDDEHPELRDIIQEGEQVLPKILKDPRWSLTLPLWVRYAVTLPRNIIYLTRDMDQAIQSWVLGRFQYYDEGIKCIDIRKKILERSLDDYAYRGIPIHRFKYPDFVRRPKAFIATLTDILKEDREIVAKIVMTIRDKSQMHRYKKDETGKDIIDYYDPETQETVFITMDIEYEEPLDFNDSGFQMLQSLSCQADAGVKVVEKVHGDAYNTEFKYEDVPYKET